MVFASWSAALVLAALPSLAWAVSGSVVVEGRVVPLPPGDWREIGRGVEIENLRYESQQYRFGKAVFVQESGGRVTGMTLVWASSNPGTEIEWLVPPVCRREDIHAQMTRSTDHRSTDCLAVGSTMPARRRGEDVAEEWRNYFDEVERRPDWMPHALVFASFRLTDPFNLLHVEYRFSPEAHGFPPDRRAWRMNGWNPANLDARRRSFLDRVSAWASAVRPALWHAFQRNVPLSLPAP